MKTGILLFFALFALLSINAQKSFSKSMVLEDLNYLYASLQETHYNLFAYTSKKDFDAHFSSLKASVEGDSLSLLETTNLFQSLVSKANNGHTEIPFPSAAYIDYAYKSGTLFPLELAFEDGKAFIRKNWSDLEELAPGTELLEINQQNLTDILSQIDPLVSAERTYFKKAKIELISFPRLYWQAFGQIDSFEIKVKMADQIKSFTVPAISLIDGFEMKRDELFSLERKLEMRENVAYLRPGNFSGDEQLYQTFIDSAFTEIKASKRENLIIDLRNNLGGDDAFSNYLVSYMANFPIKWCSSFSLKSSALLKDHVRQMQDSTQAYWKEVLQHKNGEIYSFNFPNYPPQNPDKRFKGRVYVLVNRQTHSQAAVTAAQFQDLGLAIIVGEETGEFPTLFASQFAYFLPHTEIEVKVSKGRIVRLSKSEKKEGVVPDILIKDHLSDEVDEILDGLMFKLR